MDNAGSLEDRLLIRELYGRYTDSGCRGDVEAWLGCFTPDAGWNTHIFQCAGHAEMRTQWELLWADWESMAFASEIGTMTVDGDTARARSYAREIIRLANGGLFKLFGAYDDQLVKRDGAWFFARRDYSPMIQELPESESPAIRGDRRAFASNAGRGTGPACGPAGLSAAATGRSAGSGWPARSSRSTPG